MNKRFVVSLSRAADDPDRATVAFTLAMAAIGSEQETVVFLSSDGVHLAIAGAADDIAEPGFTPLAELMQKFVAAGGLIYVCLPCFNKRGLDEAKVVPGAAIVGGPKLVAFMAPGASSISY
ncbi:MAG: DsrE family protein [Planctomycetes bacterium]|nr:DsrE family protein [Planctomycetota bacterium]MCB9885480.1 DsrE family protein [Planctomycetota bacterium]